MTAVWRLVNFAAGLERVYDPFLFPVLGTKESIKKGKTIFAVEDYQKKIYNIDLFSYSFYILKTVETGMDPSLDIV